MMRQMTERAARNPETTDVLYMIGFIALGLVALAPAILWC